MVKSFELKIVDDKMPSTIEEGILYVSFKYNVIIHMCPCGCNEKVALPIGDNGWIVTYYDGNKISLKPSIGNRCYKCKSHYYIEKNNVKWLSKMP